MLLKAHDEAKSATGFDLALYGQEMDNATRALARMNLFLHDCPTHEIWQDNTLAAPHFSYSAALDTPAKRAFFDNLGDETLAIKVDQAVRLSMQDDWRNSGIKARRIRLAIAAILGEDDALLDRTLELVRSQNDY